MSVRHSHWRNTGSTKVICEKCDWSAVKSQSRAVFLGRKHVEVTGHSVYLVRRQLKTIDHRYYAHA